jgi:uncharacterized protein YprB with RNaseH-like and TPR domain
MFEVQRRPTTGLVELAGDPALDAFRWDAAAFLDTETTSLSGGTGVLVFLTGIGCFEDGEFVVRQYLFHSPSAERRTLEEVGRALACRRHLVTFSGKAFDQHRLLERARFHRLDLAVPAGHLDLYWTSRRLLGESCRRRGLSNLRLRTLEHHVLDYHRLFDLPGSEAPEAWFGYVRGEGMSGLQGVLLHNLLDVLSLTSLAAELSLRMESPQDLGERRARAEAWWRAGRGLPAVAELAEVAAASGAGEDFRRLAGWYRRCGDFAAQGRALEEGLERCAAAADLGLLLEAAKWQEHRGRDPVKALDLARRARALARGREGAALDRRIARLAGKVESLRSRRRPSRDRRDGSPGPGPGSGAPRESPGRAPRRGSPPVPRRPGSDPASRPPCSDA